MGGTRLLAEFGAGLMYDARELRDARADYASAFLVQSAQLLKLFVDKSGGGRDETYKPDGKPIKCRVVTPRPRGREEDVAAATTSQSRVVIELEVGVAVPSTCRIAVEGTTYEVLTTDAGRAEALRQSVEVVKAK